MQRLTALRDAVSTPQELLRRIKDQTEFYDLALAEDDEGLRTDVIAQTDDLARRVSR